MRRAFLIATIMLATPALAQTKALLGLGESYVVVWRDGSAREAGNQMIGAGLNKTDTDLMRPLVACLVVDGTHVVVSNHRFLSDDSDTLSILSGVRGPTNYLMEPARRGGYTQITHRHGSRKNGGEVGLIVGARRHVLRRTALQGPRI
jgi:hypothetical protein